MNYAIGMFAIVLWFSGCASNPVAPESPVEAENEFIEMSPEAQEHVGLKVETASVQQLKEYLQVTGTVQPVDNRVSRIRPLARGRVQTVNVRVGDRVREGQALAE